MSAENKPLVTAADNKIAPQYYNPTADQYEHLQGKNGGSNVVVIESVLPAGAATSAKQDEQTAQLEALVAKDFATEVRLQAIEQKLDAIMSGTAPAIVKLTGSIGVDIFEVRKVDTQAASAGSDTVFDSEGQPVIVDYLEWATKTESSSVYLAFTPRFHFIGFDYNQAYSTFTMERLKYMGFPIFNVVRYDTSANRYHVRLKQPLYYPQGLKIERVNNLDSVQSNSIVVRGRYVL